MKQYRHIEDWKTEVLKKHPKAIFKDYGNTVVPNVKESDVVGKMVGVFCKGNLKGEIHA